MSTEPSVFTGDLSETVPAVLKNIGKRFTFGGEAPKDQRVYYFNTKELVGNKYGTPSPSRSGGGRQRGIRCDISIRCFGEYSYRISNPVLFYSNVCGNVEQSYDRSEIDSQLKSELMTALQPAFAKISEMGIRYSALPGHTLELANALNQVLSQKWSQLRGIEIVSFGVSSVKASEEDEQMIKELQRNAAFRNPTMAAAQLVGAQAAAMQDAAKNQGRWRRYGLYGYEYGRKRRRHERSEPVSDGGRAGRKGSSRRRRLICACGAVNKGSSAPSARTETGCGWLDLCLWGSEQGKVLFRVRRQKASAGVPQYKCDKCGWEPEDPTSA